MFHRPYLPKDPRKARAHYFVRITCAGLLAAAAILCSVRVLASALFRDQTLNLNAK